MTRALFDYWTDGYCDGLDPDMTAPTPARHADYRAGFKQGRDDLREKPDAAVRRVGDTWTLRAAL